MNKVILVTKKGNTIVAQDRNKYTTARWQAYHYSRKPAIAEARAVGKNRECLFVKGRSITIPR